MEVKKNPKADLENKKNIFLEIGFMVTLVAVLFAFEWKVSVVEPSSFITVSDVPTEPEMVPITMMNQQPMPPPPAPRQFELIDIVDELDPMTEDVELIDASDEKENTEEYVEGLNYGPEDLGDEIVPFLPSEDMPIFPGNVQKWIAKNVKYPAIAAENGIEGKVYIQFVIERNGTVTNIKVVRSVDASLDKEAVRVISEMPKWKPGKQRGIPVRVAYTLPIAFQLNR